MAIKKSTPTPPKPPRPGGPVPPDTKSIKISSGVKVLGGIDWMRSMTGEIRKNLTPAQMKEATALAARIRALQSKVAADKKTNAKIIKKQNKKPLVTGRGATKPVTPSTIGAPKKPVVKVKPPKGRPGLRGGMGGGGGLFGGRGLGGTR